MTGSLAVKTSLFLDLLAGRYISTIYSIYLDIPNGHRGIETLLALRRAVLLHSIKILRARERDTMLPNWRAHIIPTHKTKAQHWTAASCFKLNNLFGKVQAMENISHITKHFRVFNVIVARLTCLRQCTTVIKVQGGRGTTGDVRRQGSLWAGLQPLP